ncbi:MAG: hypothetical protein ACREQT_12190 [Candidatus Binataceae bacterium]
MSEDNHNIAEAFQLSPISTAASDALTHRFNDAVAIFNNNQDNTIGGWLDDNVTVFSVSSNRPVTGKQGVEQYFTQQFKDNPRFTPLTPIIVAQNGRTSTVQGTAKWVDDNGTDTIDYVFKFVFDSTRGWLILSLWGA